MQSNIAKSMRAASMNACIKKENRLLLSKNQLNEGNHAAKVSAATINSSNKVMGFLQIVPVAMSQYRVVATGCTHKLSSISDQRFHWPIKVCKRCYKPEARCYTQHSAKARNEVSEDRKRKGSSKNIRTTFRGAFDRRACSPVNITEKYKLQLKQAEANL